MLERYGELSIYIWLGTCDLTIKGKYVALKSNYLDVSAKTIEKYQSLLDDTRFKGLKLFSLKYRTFPLKSTIAFLAIKTRIVLLNRTSSWKRQLANLIAKFTN